MNNIQSPLKFHFRPGSGWTFELELECFLILKKLEGLNFARGECTDLCKSLKQKHSRKGVVPSVGSLNAKIGNFKSEAGYTNPTHSSDATKYIMAHYGKMSRKEAEDLLKGYQLADIGSCDSTAAQTGQRERMSDAMREGIALHALVNS